MDKRKEFMKELGALCRRCRERLGKTQQEIADAVGMTAQNVCRFESGERDSLFIFSVYGMRFSGQEWRELNGIYNRYFAE